MEQEKVNVSLSKNQALVLFEFLGRFNEKEHKDLFEDQAEQRVLWDIEAILESELAEPFCADYLEIITRARDDVRDKE